MSITTLDLIRDCLNDKMHLNWNDPEDSNHWIPYPHNINYKIYKTVKEMIESDQDASKFNLIFEVVNTSGVLLSANMICFDMATQVKVSNCHKGCINCVDKHRRNIVYKERTAEEQTAYEAFVASLTANQEQELDQIVFVITEIFLS